MELMMSKIMLGKITWNQNMMFFSSNPNFYPVICN